MSSRSGKRLKKKSKKGDAKTDRRDLRPSSLLPLPHRERQSKRKDGGRKDKKSRKGSSISGDHSYLAREQKEREEREREWEREQEHKKEWDRKQLEKLEKLELERLRQLEQKRAIEIQQLQLQLQQHKKHRSERESTGHSRVESKRTDRASRKGDTNIKSRDRTRSSSSRKGRTHKDKSRDEKLGERREHCESNERGRESKHGKDLRLNTTLNIRKPCTGKVEPIYNSHGKLIKFIVMRIENCSSCSIDISYYKHPTHRDEILAATVSPGSTVIVNISDAYSVFYQCCSCGDNNGLNGLSGLSTTGHSRIRSLYSSTRGTGADYDNTNDDETLLMPHTTLTPIRSASSHPNTVIGSTLGASNSTSQPFSLLGQQQPTKLCVMTIVIQAQVERP